MKHTTKEYGAHVALITGQKDGSIELTLTVKIPKTEPIPEENSVIFVKYFFL